MVALMSKPASRTLCDGTRVLLQMYVAKFGMALCNGSKGADPNRGVDRAAAADQSEQGLYG